jgi:hypothetical protein
MFLAVTHAEKTNQKCFHLFSRCGVKTKHFNNEAYICKFTTCYIITGLFISLKMRHENISEKEPISADEGTTKRAL